MKKKTKTILGSAILLLVVVGSVLGVIGYRVYYDRQVPNFTGKADLYIYPDTPVDSVKAMVTRQCLPLNISSVDRAFREVTFVKPGHYVVDSTVSSTYVARMLTLGWQTPVKLVLSGTMRKKDAIARKISRQMMVDSATVARALDDENFLSRYGFTPATAFALIRPDTYEVYWTDSLSTVFNKQKKAYDAFWTEENKAKAAAQGLTPMEVATVASIVNGETLYEPEMPSIAGVYLNRYHKGMKLQADPTVAYCYGYTLDRILRKHLTVDSPYNTYKHAGLPPAPICVPTTAALNAVLNPDSHAYLYFCASSDFNGTHKFATNLAGHMVNARAFHKALTKRQKERAAAAK